MQLPADTSRISLVHGFEGSTSYPPVGFYPFSEYQLGNGDTFGLYWPIGREAEEPIVAETRHDEWLLAPGYSSLRTFLAAVEGLDEEERPEVPALQADPRSPLACLNAAQNVLSAPDGVEPAVALLKTAVAVLPEFTEALGALGAQYIRLGRHSEACVVAVQAIISPPCFGPRAGKLLRWLASQSHGPPDLVDDPIWAARRDLRLQYGGTKENSDYALLRAAIERYADQGQLVKSLTLMQTYGELMSAETVSFQERHDFQPGEFRMKQLAMSSRLPGGARTLPAVS